MVAKTAVFGALILMIVCLMTACVYATPISIDDEMKLGMGIHVGNTVITHTTNVVVNGVNGNNGTIKINDGGGAVMVHKDQKTGMTSITVQTSKPKK